VAKNWAIGLDKVALDAFEFIGNAEVKLRTQTVKARLSAFYKH